ncbi:uncharacterized protein LOC130905205 [Corythoichthys intestinalis]|uniref:uncharacterized protein LOC130905205 n=1 Tax=Corythoichthys intestinalis TaxID=161448 RepID=UPI0025A5F886|nr:uncharacterized protein LOC130905205 [Corythoichthys intestinalis]
MDEVMGGRPLANVDVHGVDVGFEEELCDGDSSSLNAAPDAETNVCISDNVHNSMEWAEENTEASEDSTSQTSDSTVPRAVKKKTQSKTTSSYERALLTWSAHQQAFMESMQASQNQWYEQQRVESHRQEERMLSKFLEESSRSNERLLGHLFDGLRAILPHSSQAPSHAQFQHPHTHSYSPPPYATPQHPYPQSTHPYSQPTHPYSQPQHFNPRPDDSEYTLQDLD